MKLKLIGELKDKEHKKFFIPKEFNLENFDGYQYYYCLCGIYKDNNGKFQYSAEWSRMYISAKIAPSQFLSFVELHKDMIIKEKCYDNGKFVTLYYVVFEREEKPMVLNAFNTFDKQNVDIEIIFTDGNYYRPAEIHLALDPYITILDAIQNVFANANLEVLKFISKTDTDAYKITYYNEHGITKEFTYTDLKTIYNHITNIRLVGVNNAD